MSDGNEVIISGGSLKIEFKRDHFTESDNKFHHKGDHKTALVSLSINGGTPIMLDKKDVITIHYEVKP